MLYYFKKGKNTIEMHKKICAVYGEGAVTDWTCQRWFAKFHAGDFSLDDASRSGRPVQVDSDQIKTIIENNQRYTTREIPDILKISKLSIENYLHQVGYVNRFDVWDPHKSSKKNLLDHISTWGSLLIHNENVPFLKQIVTGDEKCVLMKCGMEVSRGQVKWTTTNHTKGRSSFKESDVVYMVGWEGSPLLWALSGKPNNSFQQVLLPIRPMKSGTPRKVSRISQQKTHYLPSG